LVEEALERIDRREFGLCVQCERPIASKRIEVQPWARYCLRCQELADSGLTEDSDFPSEDEDREGADNVDEVELDDESLDDVSDNERLAGG
jgi:RNA polymerase-binding transcription factor DksA